MTTPGPPQDPKKMYERWYDETGEVWVWDGKVWVPLDDPYFSPTTPFRGD